PFEHILGSVRREIRYELVVNRQVRREHKKIIDAMCKVEISDERAHQPRLAYAGGKRKAERWKFPLEIRHCRIFAAQNFQSCLQIRRLVRWNDFCDTIQ